MEMNDLNGYERIYTDIHGDTRIYTDIHGDTRIYTDIHGYTRIYTEIAIKSVRCAKLTDKSAGYAKYHARDRIRSRIWV